MGDHVGEFDEPPTVGHRFMLIGDRAMDTLITGTVQGVRKLPDGSIGFRTKRSTYVLTPEAK
jgi:hypothetical protein